jgi:hypothetical protein
MAGVKASILLLAGLCGWSMGATSVSQHNITVKFESDMTTGQFVNGDYYVVGEVNIINVDPCSSATMADSACRNGIMIDPNGGEKGANVVSTAHGFDSRIVGYDADLNEAWPGDANITSSNPLTVEPNASLVICKSGASATVADWMILTVLSQAPAANSFRPAYANTDKTISYNETDIDYETLLDLDPCGTEPTWADINDQFMYPLIQISSSTSASYLSGARMSAHDDFAMEGGEAMLKLNCNYTDAEKRAATIYLCQLGIDIYGVITENAGGRAVYKGIGAFSLGKKVVVMFTGTVLGDTAMIADMTAKSGAYGETNARDGAWPTITPPADYYYFTEDDDTFYLTEWDRDGPPFTIYMALSAELDSGTVNVTNGSQIVTCDDCNFLAAKPDGFMEWADLSCCKTDVNNSCDSGGSYGYQYGVWFAIQSDSEVNDVEGRPYDIVDFNDTNMITIRRAYEGDTASGVAFYIAKHMVYGHGAGRKSNYNNCYRGIDYNEPAAARVGWATWGDNYLGGAGQSGEVRAMRDYEWVDGGYRENCGRNYGGQALVMCMMGLKTAWNNDAFFDYTDFYVIQARANAGQDFQSDTSFNEDMFDEYWSTYYGATYAGPATATYFLGIYTP